NFLEYEGNEPLYFLAVPDVGPSELLGHEPLFRFRLGEPADKRQKEGKDSTKFSERQCSTEYGEKKPGVNRVTNERVRTTSNQFVRLLHCDHRAPIRPEMQTRPYRICTACCSHAKAYRTEPRLWRKQPKAKYPSVCEVGEQKGKGRRDQSQMKYPRRGLFRS